jgi:hypothetical protein
MGGVNLGWLGLAPKSWNKKAHQFLTGTPEKRENVSTLRPEQEQLYNQLQQAGMQKGAGGAFGDSADYYRDLLSDNPQDMEAFAAPEQRRFNEETIPGLAEQFAGMGSGGLSSSGFRNAAVGAGTDLSERLGAIRANLRQSGAAGLQGIGQAGLGNFSQNMVTEPGSEGFLGQVAPAVGTAIGAFGGPAGAAAGNAAGNMFKNAFSGNKVGANSSPYGNQQMSPSSSNGFNLPKFGAR